MQFYLVQYNDKQDYETFHAEDSQHAKEQALDSRPDSTISAVFLCLELDDAGQALFPHEVRSAGIYVE